MRSSKYLLILWWLAACTSAPSPEEDVAAFANMDASVAYVGSAACATCHEDLWQSYQQHGMAQSWAPVDAVMEKVALPSEAVYDASRNLSYRVYRDGDRYVQEETRLDPDGKLVHRLVRPMTYVVGNGNVAHTYVSEENGRLYQLPLTWYSQQGKWDFSPGYREGNQRFDRLIPTRCIACHNDRVQPVPFAEGKYIGEIPSGIGCEQCHGPGALHVEARLQDAEPADSIDRTIVNPRYLTLDKRLDVCQQCHLQATVSVLREGQAAYSFRPGQSLDAHVSFFGLPSDVDEVGVISHAERMKKSACFIASQPRGGMDCVTCHNPHEPFRDKGPAYFTSTCLTCHSTAALRDRFEGTPQAATHQPASNCITCHMPAVESSEAPHSSFTDHWIRIVDETPAPPRPSGERVTLVPYFARDREGAEAEVYEGMAYVVYGQQRGDREALRRGVEILDQALTEQSGYGEAHYLLGFARYQLGQAQAALPALEAARASNPGIPERLNTLALAYEATGAPSSQVLALYEEALRLQPALAEVRVNYGRYLEKLGRIDAAAEQYALAAREQPSLSTTQYNLGTAYLRQGDLAQAEQTLRRAVTLDPDNDQARGNLGLLYASQGRAEEARAQFVAAVEAAPQSAVALGNLGTYYLNSEQPQRAQPLLEKAVTLDPGYIDALVNLALLHAQAGRPAEAQRYARQALQVRPDEPRAQQILRATGG